MKPHCLVAAGASEESELARIHKTSGAALHLANSAYYHQSTMIIKIMRAELRTTEQTSEDLEAVPLGEEE